MRTFTADAAAIRLLRAQHGYASVGQLHEVGLSRGQIAHRVSRGILHREGRGVVSLTPPDLTATGRAMRSVLLVGSGAVASLWTAAALHRLSAPRSRQTHVVVEGNRRQREDDDLFVHRTRWLPKEHITVVGAVPVTAVPRTLADCARLLDHWRALEMLDSVHADATMWAAIHTAATLLSNGRAGVRALAAATAPDGAQRLRSTLERLAREALGAYDVPAGEWNVVVRDGDGRVREVDLCFHEAKLIVEIDGLRYHDRADRAARDRRSDRRLQLAGWRVLRFTWRDVVHDPAGMARQVMRALQL
jgi:hypothetical protein